MRGDVAELKDIAGAFPLFTDYWATVNERLGILTVGWGETVLGKAETPIKAYRLLYEARRNFVRMQDRPCTQGKPGPYTVQLVNTRGLLP